MSAPQHTSKNGPASAARQAQNAVRQRDRQQLLGEVRMQRTGGLGDHDQIAPQQLNAGHRSPTFRHLSEVLVLERKRPVQLRLHVLA